MTFSRLHERRITLAKAGMDSRPRPFLPSDDCLLAMDWGPMPTLPNPFCE